MNEENVIEQLEYKGYTIKIVPDYCPEDPRGWSNLGTMYCKHRRYNLGDVHEFDSTEDLLAFVRQPDVISLPLYLYDHSIQCMSTQSFVGRAVHAEWDSGMVGYIYVTKQRAREDHRWKRLTAKRIQYIVNQLRGEVSTYSSYLSGSVYGFIIEDAGGEIVDSCYGYYDYDDSERMLRDHFNSGEDQAIIEAKSNIDAMVREELKNGIQTYLPGTEEHFQAEVSVVRQKLDTPAQS